MRATAAGPREIGDLPALRRVARAASALDRHEAALRRTARRHSASPQDAEDAYQRTAEILLRRGPERDGAALLAWLQVVVRREALALRRERIRRRPALAPSRDGFDPDRLPSAVPGPLAVLERSERAAGAARRLRRLKRDERRALALQAAGCSYAEIQSITGWSYTKVNRCLAEGRAALRGFEPLPRPA